MNAELWKLIAAIGGLLVTAVTGPIIWAVRAEFRASRAETLAVVAASEARLKLEMKDMEARLNERIDTRLVHR